MTLTGWGPAGCSAGDGSAVGGKVGWLLATSLQDIGDAPGVGEANTDFVWLEEQGVTGAGVESSREGGVGKGGGSASRGQGEAALDGVKVGTLVEDGVKVGTLVEREGELVPELELECCRGSVVQQTRISFLEQSWRTLARQSGRGRPWRQGHCRLDLVELVGDWRAAHPSSRSGA